MNLKVALTCSKLFIFTRLLEPVVSSVDCLESELFALSQLNREHLLLFFLSRSLLFWRAIQRDLLR